MFKNNLTNPNIHININIFSIYIPAVIKHFNFEWGIFIINKWFSEKLHVNCERELDVLYNIE